MITFDDFKYMWQVSTGQNLINGQWIQDNVPSNTEDKYKYFKKLIYYIQLVQNHGNNGEVHKWGRFDGWWFTSELVKAILDIVFGSDTSVIKLTKDNTIKSSDEISNPIQNSFYLIGSPDIDSSIYMNIYNGYLYVGNQFLDKGFFVVMDDNDGSCPNKLYTTNIKLLPDTSECQYDILYKINEGNYIVYKYSEQSQCWLKTNEEIGEDTEPSDVMYLKIDNNEYLYTENGDKIRLK